MPVECDPCYGHLVINGVNLHNPHGAWGILDPSAVAGTGNFRGGNVEIPQGDDLPFPRDHATTQYDLPLAVAGDVDHATGATNDDPYQGVLDNLAFLKANLGFADQSGDGTVSASWVQPDGTTITTTVTMLPFQPQLLAGGHATGTLSFEVAAGEFA
jgi:hypothetical protein